MVKRHAALVLISMGIWVFSLPVLANRRHGSIVPYPTGTAIGKRSRYYRNRRAKLSSTESRCREEVRQPASAAERAVVRKGWKLYGPVQSYGTTIVFTALAGFDGMCRPLGYQAFLYSEGRYAGTLSPVPMNSGSGRVAYESSPGPLDSHYCRVCPLSRFRPTLLPVKDEHSRIPGPKRRSPCSYGCKRHDEAGGSDAGANWRQSR